MTKKQEQELLEKKALIGMVSKKVYSNYFITNKKFFKPGYV